VTECDFVGCTVLQMMRGAMWHLTLIARGKLRLGYIYWCRWVTVHRTYSIAHANTRRELKQKWRFDVNKEYAVIRTILGSDENRLRSWVLKSGDKQAAATTATVFRSWLTRLSSSVDMEISVMVKSIWFACCKNLGPFHHRVCCCNSIGVSPLEAQSAGLSAPGTWNQFIGFRFDWISDTLLPTKVLNDDDWLLIQSNTIVESVHARISSVGLLIEVWMLTNSCDSSTAPQSSNLGTLILRAGTTRVLDETRLMRGSWSS